jgi:hypothetical protein
MTNQPFDIVGYTFKADNYCPKCVIKKLTPYGFNSVADDNTEELLNQLALSAHIDREDERSFDSDNFPKVVFRDQARGYGINCGWCGSLFVPINTDVEELLND